MRRPRSRLADSAVLSDGSFTLAPPLLQTFARGATDKTGVPAIRAEMILRSLREDLSRDKTLGGLYLTDSGDSSHRKSSVLAPSRGAVGGQDERAEVVL